MRGRDVRSEREGRERTYELETARIANAHVCLDRLSARWDEALARLQTFVER